MVKRSLLADYKAQRYSKPMCAMKLKDDDRVVTVTISTGKEVFITTQNGYGLRYSVEEIPVTGIRASGVKAINLKDDLLVDGHIFDDMEYLTVITKKNTGKRVKLSEFEVSTRARRGVQIIREVKTNPYYILKTFIIGYKENLSYMTKDGMNTIKLTELPITDRYGTGTSISKTDITSIIEEVKVITKEEQAKVKVEEKENISLEKIDEKIMTIDDFLSDFESNK